MNSRLTHKQGIRVLLVEDVEYEAELALHELERAGLSFEWRRVQTEAHLRQGLAEFEPNIILSDFNLPQFNGLEALKVAREVVPETPFIFVSGTIGEERAIDALLAGAADYVLKGNLLRLAPAVKRALADAQARTERARQQAQIARLARVVDILSAVNALVVRVRDRTELLRETCREAVRTGGYRSAVAYYKAPGAPALTALTGSGTDALRQALAAPTDPDVDLLSHIARAGTIFLCNDPADPHLPAPLRTAMEAGEVPAVVGLPLVVDRTPVGVLLLAPHESDAVGARELQALGEIAGNLSFALQYLRKDSRVRMLSHFDPNTGLPKRSLFCDRISRVLADPARPAVRVVVSIMDIERMSLINDSYGRRIGDLLLQQVAERLRSRFRNHDRLAHLGGGTFAVFVDASSVPAAELLVSLRANAAALFGSPFSIEQHEISVGIRSGLALHPEDGMEAGALVQHAELALQEARASGARELNYSAEKHSETMGRLALEQKLSTALERRQFILHYQPKVDFATGRISGAEALLRWQDPQVGLISPAAFLPVLESSGLILEVGAWVVEQAARDCQQWLRAGLPPVRVAVNISPLQLRQVDFTSRFLDATRAWASTLAGLDVEITEGALLEDSTQEIGQLAELRSQGAKIAIDDFGTGYSSLARLSSLPVDTLKIDRSFVKQLPDSGQGLTLVKTVISLAQAFAMTTVAEGVETQGQFDLLRECGCTESQGFLHSRPVSAEAFMTMLGRDGLPKPRSG